MFQNLDVRVNLVNVVVIGLMVVTFILFLKFAANRWPVGPLPNIANAI